MTALTILPTGKDPVTAFAAEELRRCLTQATGRVWVVRRRAARTGNAVVLRLGTFADLALDSGPSADAALDDIAVRTAAAGGDIAGATPRCVLLATYAYLTRLGFRWVRPGKDGELVPQLALPLAPVALRETASYRHRGVCIEGAVSEEHVRAMIDWLPKLGFNAYFIQFREAFNFFQRWYEHTGNPTLGAAPFSMDKARELTRALRTEVKRRGLDLHMTGHGWTCEPFGIPGPGWFVHQGPVPAAAVPHLAEVKGKRELWGGIALNTNLCYGNDATRTIVTDAIVAWSRDNPDVDTLHFWLADGSNNQCECPRCRDTRPADLYVRMLNELDEKLTAAGLPVRIVFLVYVDLLWPPEHELLHHPERFILMFAPITRSYSTPFAAGEAPAEPLPPYARNRLSFPRQPAGNLAFLRAWQRGFHGDSFDFDYHFMWDHHRDPGQYAMAQVLHQDCVNLRAIGLNGLVSCQNQRVFFPTGLGMTVMGRTLWNRDLPFAAIARDYFTAAFGPQGETVQAYLQAISERFHPPLLRGECSAEEKAAAPARLRSVRGLVDGMQPLIAAGVNSAEPCHAASWRYLEFHAEFAVLFADALAELYGGAADVARSQAMALFDWCRRHELELQTGLDVYEFLCTVAPLFGIPRRDVE